MTEQKRYFFGGGSKMIKLSKLCFSYFLESAIQVYVYKQFQIIIGAQW